VKEIAGDAFGTAQLISPCGNIFLDCESCRYFDARTGQILGEFVMLGYSSRTLRMTRPLASSGSRCARKQNLRKQTSDGLSVPQKYRLKLLNELARRTAAAVTFSEFDVAIDGEFF
jgi:hypothetical protein